MREAAVAFPKSAAGDVQKNDGRRGAVLVELVVAFALVGLLLSLAWPNWRGKTSRGGLIAAAVMTEGFLREARLLARKNGLDVAVEVNRDRRRLTAANGVLALPGDVALVYDSAIGCGGRVLFHADGTSCGGLLHLKGPNYAAAIRIEGATGDVRFAR
jgi:hypothetical protein